MIELENSDEESSIADDTYAAQREELFTLLKDSIRAQRTLVVHGEERLSVEDLLRVWQKIRHGYGFSAKERSALADAGFDLNKILPGR